MTAAAIVVPPIRSQLFVPGNRRDWMDKALGSGADALALDLEDAVPPQEKDRARQRTQEFLEARGAERWCTVRVAPADDPRCLGDIEVAVAGGARAIALPKVESLDDIVVADRLISWAEARCGRPVGSTALTPSLETAWAIHFAHAVATASPRVALTGAVAPRGGDVERNVGYRWTPSGEESFAFRSNVLLAMRAAGVANPLSGLWTDVGALDGLERLAVEARAIGYDGLVVIHPSHVSIVNRVFTAAPQELRYHRELIAALEAAQAEGRAAIQFRGAMVDIAMLETARAVLAQADGG